MAAAQRSEEASISQRHQSTIIPNVMPDAEGKGKEIRVSEDKKRERNILSSRKYRAKRFL